MATQLLGWLIALVSLTGQAFAQELDARQAALPQPLTTRQHVFTIPFQVPPGKDFVEVQLHVAEFPTMRWALYHRQHPSARGFPFRATHDGQYVFAVRSIDRTGRLHPASSLRPEMLVVIDTTPPQLDLEVLVGPAGDLQATWQATDERIDAGSLQLEYQAEPDTAWVPMAIETAALVATDGQTVSGQMNWWPQGSASLVHVRGRVKDTAGNATVVQRQIKLPRVAQQQTGEILGSGRSGGPPARHGLALRHRSDGGIPWSIPDHPTRVESPGLTRNHAAGQSWVQRADGGSLRRDSQFSRGQHPHDSESAANRLTSNSRLTARTVSTILPHDVMPHQTQATRFSLDYDLQMVGPTGVRAVHLWGTSDSGQTWTKWLTDADRVSPFQVEVPREGIYGFRIVVENNDGLALPPPQPGDAPDVWVVVDPIEPQVELTSAQYGRGADEGSLLITWKASDDHLLDRPVTLRYASDPAAGWQTIVGNLPNTGQYTWRVDRHVPQQVILRIEVRDRAGNVGVHTLQEPINTRGLVPQARIRGIRPLSKAPASAQRVRTIR